MAGHLKSRDHDSKLNVHHWHECEKTYIFKMKTNQNPVQYILMAGLH